MTSDKDITYPGKEADQAINQALENSGKGALIVLAGRNNSGKSDTIFGIKKSAGSLKEIDLRNIVSTHEKETYANLDKMFEELSSENAPIVLQNGDVLSGEYTGYTYSTQRYASPQERHLIKKISESDNVILLELMDDANVTNSLRRLADAIVYFPIPKSGFAGLIWKLKQIRVHGHTFENRRPIGAR